MKKYKLKPKLAYLPTSASLTSLARSYLVNNLTDFGGACQTHSLQIKELSNKKREQLRKNSLKK